LDEIMAGAASAPAPMADVFRNARRLTAEVFFT
jgi:hypothetical protein